MVPQLSFQREFDYNSKPDVTNCEVSGTPWKEAKVRKCKMITSKIKNVGFAKKIKPMWHCPLGCGKSLQKTSSRSIHKHRRECFRTFIGLWQSEKSSSTKEMLESFFLLKIRGLNSLIQFCFVGTEQGKMLNFFRAPNCEVPKTNIVEQCWRILTFSSPSDTMNLVSNGQGLQYYHQSAWVNGRVLVFIVGISSAYQGASISNVLDCFIEAYKAEHMQAIQQLSPRHTSKDSANRFQIPLSRDGNLLHERKAVIASRRRFFREPYEDGRVRAAKYLLPKYSLQSENIDGTFRKLNHGSFRKLNHSSEHGRDRSLLIHKIPSLMQYRSNGVRTSKCEPDPKGEFSIPAEILLQLASHGDKGTSFENQSLKLGSCNYGADVPALAPRILKRKFTRTDAACETCHRMKVRCKMGANGQRFPCAGCIKRGLQNSCTAYCSMNKRQKKRKPLQSLSSEICVTNLQL